MSVGLSLSLSLSLSLLVRFIRASAQIMNYRNPPLPPPPYPPSLERCIVTGSSSSLSLSLSLSLSVERQIVSSSSLAQSVQHEIV